MARTSEQMAVEEIAEAIGALNLGLDATTGHADVDLVLTSGGHRTAIQVKHLATTSPADARRIISEAAQRHSDDVVAVLVADQITPGARQILNDAGWGWLDRRGHLRLHSAGIHIDTDIAPLLDDTDRRPGRGVLDTPAGLDTAAAVLTFTERTTIRAIAERTGRSVGATHQALHALAEVGLVDRHWQPLHRELFWELARRWAPKRIPLAGRPEPGDHRRTSQLLLGLDDIDTGWALADSIAANLYGAPAPVRGDDPPDFYVPDQRTVRVARQLYGDAETYTGRASTVAIAPISWVCTRRVDAAALGSNAAWSEFGLAHPLFVALDLALDAGRGTEILESWTPPKPYHRVW